jgi:hypothetical protein
MTAELYFDPSTFEFRFEGVSPSIRLIGDEVSGADVSIKEHAGKIYLYDNTNAENAGIVYPMICVAMTRHIAEASAATAFDEPVFQSPTNTTWKTIECGIIPLINKSTTGSGTTVMSTRNFDVEVAAYTKQYFGSFGYTSVASNEVLTIKKVVRELGQIVPSGAFYVMLQRIS